LEVIQNCFGWETLTNAKLEPNSIHRKARKGRPFQAKPPIAGILEWSSPKQAQRIITKGEKTSKDDSTLVHIVQRKIPHM
jgi:hypothetical protein